MPTLFQLTIDVLYRHPLARIKKTNRFGGYPSYFKMLRNRRLMKRAATRLSPVISHPGGLPVYFLTGKKYLYQTLFCIKSLQQHSTELFNFTLVDDGTMDASLIALIKRQLPGAAIITRETIRKNLQNMLPAELYPVLNNKRREYPHIKKLTDIHTLPGNPWKMVLDSDMLFWNDPREVIGWLKDPIKPVHMIDCVESYGYSRALMEKLAGSQLPSLLNVGIIGLNSAAIDWKKIEIWIKELEHLEDKSYYLEQALSAMLLAKEECQILPAETYIVNPSGESLSVNLSILHHYVDLSKKEYFNNAWKVYAS